MVVWLMSTALGVPQLISGFPEAPPVAPTDIAAGRQSVDLRAPLVARTRGAKLVLFVRDRSALSAAHIAAFEAAIPRSTTPAMPIFVASLAWY